MWEKETKMRWLPIKSLVIICLLLQIVAYGKDYSSLKSAQKLLNKRKKEILKLTEKEKRTFKDLARLEGEIGKLEDRIYKEEVKLKNLRKEIRSIENKIASVSRDMSLRKRALEKLIKIYWSLYVKHIIQDFRQRLLSFDVYKNWILILTLEIKNTLENLKESSHLLMDSLKEKREIERRILLATKSLIKQREALLAKKLYLISQIKRIRAIRLYKEAQLKEIREIIKRLKLTSVSWSHKRIKTLKGRLPWPLEGKVAFKFNLKAKPPIEGIGICVKKLERVRSVLWGKVVFSDKLRGFGRVVIIFHGNNFYSLYAYLKESYVFVGQRVEQSEPIGMVGFCPRCKGPGLYFEIRHGKKPVNPLKWLKNRRSE